MTTISTAAPEHTQGKKRNGIVEREMNLPLQAIHTKPIPSQIPQLHQALENSKVSDRKHTSMHLKPHNRWQSCCSSRPHTQAKPACHTKPQGPLWPWQYYEAGTTVVNQGRGLSGCTLTGTPSPTLPILHPFKTPQTLIPHHTASSICTSSSHPGIHFQ